MTDTSLDNLHLREVDELVRSIEADPDKQLGILIVACVLAIRRMCHKRMIFDNLRKAEIAAQAIKLFSQKVRLLLTPR